MGSVINSRDFEQGYMLDAKGEYAYFSVRGDIYQLKNPFKPEPVVLVYGKVINEKTGEPMAAEISYYDLDTDEKLGTAVSNDETGEYKIVLPYGKNYGFSANQEKFFAVSENIDTRHLTEYTEMEKNLTLTPIIKGEVIQLHNIFFETGSATLLGESKHELDKLYKFLDENPDVKVEIAGHTDNVGEAEANLKLSHNRAFAVMDYLIKKGINKKQMQEKGYGETNPLVPNDTDENRAINRRVELEIL
jgi:outer membrane protein OmpA-like peptidoglycan-associated protein